MKNVYKMFLISASASVLCACGSGGSGSGAVTPIKGIQFGGVNALGSSSGSAVYDKTLTENGMLYSYTMGGKTYNVTDKVGELDFDGEVLMAQTGNTFKWVSGGSYSRFGGIVDTGTNQVGLFYTGSPTEIMPTRGKAKYVGKTILTDAFAYGAMPNSAMSMDSSFDVDFAQKKMTGNASRGALNINYNGTLNGASVNGGLKSLLTDGVRTEVLGSGTFNGSFFGPNAQELAGVGKVGINDTKLGGDINGTTGIVFGAQKQ